MVPIASLIPMLNTGVFNMATAAVYPWATNMPTGNILWLDAMLPDCVVYDNPTSIISIGIQAIPRAPSLRRCGPLQLRLQLLHNYQSGV